MNKTKLIGVALVASSLMLGACCAATEGGVAEDYVGKAIWYLPYAALVTGLRKLVRA